jgi:hypothetical protein
MIFRNHEQLMEQINNDLLPVMDKIGAKVQKKIKFHINEVVYKPYTEHVRKYERQGEDGGFIGSWIYDFSYSPTGNLILRVYSEPDLMTLDQERHIHGRPDIQEEGLIGQEFDRRENMDMLIAEGKGYDFEMSEDASTYIEGVDNWWTRPRDYFTPTLDELDMGELSGYTRSALKEFGFSIKGEF